MPLRIRKKTLKPVKEIVKDFNLLIPLVANLYNWEIEDAIGDTEALNTALDRTIREDVDDDEEEEYDRETLRLQSKILNDYDDFYENLINSENLIWDKNRPIESAEAVLDIWDKTGMDRQILKMLLLTLWMRRSDDEVGVAEGDTFRYGVIESLALENWDELDEKIDELDEVVVVELKYKGVDLLLDPETNEVYDPETNDKVGIWDGKDVDFFKGFEILEDEDEEGVEVRKIEQEINGKKITLYVDTKTGDVYNEDGELVNEEGVELELVEKKDKVYTSLFIDGKIITVRQIDYEVDGKEKTIYLDEKTNRVYDNEGDFFGIVPQEDVDDDIVEDWYENEL